MYCKLPIPVVLLFILFSLQRFFVNENKFSRAVLFAFPQTVFHLKCNSTNFYNSLCISHLPGFFTVDGILNFFTKCFLHWIKRIGYFGLFSSNLTSNSHFFIHFTCKVYLLLLRTSSIFWCSFDAVFTSICFGQCNNLLTCKSFNYCWFDFWNDLPFRLTAKLTKHI